MSFTRSQIFLACALASSLLFSACSKENKPQKEDALTATAPATGEASTIIERNAKQRLIETLQKQFKNANINVKILDIKPTEVPNLYWVNLEGMTSVYTTSDGKYLIQGDVIRLGGKELHNIGDSLQASENKKHLAALKNEDLIVYPAKGGNVYKRQTLHGHAANSLCQLWKRFGVVQTVKLHLTKLYRALVFHLLNVKTLFANNTNLV